MILTTYKYIVNGYKKTSNFNKKDVFNNYLNLFIESFSFNYFSLTKLIYGIPFSISGRFLPIHYLKIKV